MNVKKKVRQLLRLLPDEKYVKIVYYLTFKRKLNLNNPELWTEKIQYKKLYDRRDLLTQSADKIEVKKISYKKLKKNITPNILWEGKSPKDIPFSNLPNSFVIKTNHGSGTNIIVKSKANLNIKDTINQLNLWLNLDYYYLEKEWAYKNIDRKVFVEELAETKDGSLPSDIKFYMFNGELEAINIHQDRFNDNHSNILLDKNFHNLEDKNSKDYSHLKPLLFDEMVKDAKILASDFDFIRVDFYDLEDSYLLSELTNYPVGGFKRIDYALDYYLGGKLVRNGY